MFLLIGGFISNQNLNNEKYLMNDSFEQEDFALNKPITTNTGIGSKRINDGKNNTAYQALQKNNIEIEIDLLEETLIDSIVLKEDGLNISSFEIHLFIDDEWEKVYEQNKIEYYRLATFDERTTNKVKVVIKEADQLPSIRSIEIYHLGKYKNDDFKVTAYISVGHLYDALMDGELTENEINNLFGTEYYDLYTDVFFIFDIRWDEFGEITYDKGKEKFSRTIQLFQDMIGERDVNIFVTILNPHDNEIVLDTITNKRETLIQNIIAFSVEHNLDGVDFDWEFPFTDEEYDAYNSFLQELKPRLQKEIKPDFQLSLALATWALKYEQETIDIIDQVQVMGYDILDQDGQHSSFYGAAVQPVQYLLDQGFHKEQLNIGVPFYGTYIEGRMEQYLYKSLDSHDFNQNYYNIEDVGVVSFNSPQMLKDKTAYALHNGYGGVMVFSLYCDLEMDNDLSLSNAINNILKERME
jgi:hypothetical protein